MSTDVVDRYAHERGFHWPRLRELGLSAPLHWLDRGFHDMLAAPVASLFYGAMLATMGYLITHFYGGAVGLALTTGFLPISPFLATPPATRPMISAHLRRSWPSASTIFHARWSSARAYASRRP